MRGGGVKGETVEEMVEGKQAGKKKKKKKTKTKRRRCAMF
jgi:hypothetical protein